jgi:acetyl esterase/lipase
VVRKLPELSTFRQVNLARRVVVVAVSALLAVGIAAPGSARPGSARPDSARPRTPIAETANVDYGPSVLTAFYDPTRSSAPWIGLVHGGSWYSGSRRTYSGLAQRWRRAGFQVFTIDYRLAPAAIWPAQRDDVSRAVRYIQTHAARYHLDAADGVLVGQSAGAQIVAEAADSGAVHVRAVVDLSGVVVPYLAWLDGHDTATRSSRAATQLANHATLFMGCPPQQNRPACWDRWTDASAPAHVSAHDPPTLIVASEFDPIVPAWISTYYAQKLAAAGVPYTLRILPGATVHDVLGLPGIAALVLAWIRAQSARAI